MKKSTIFLGSIFIVVMIIIFVNNEPKDDFNLKQDLSILPEVRLSTSTLPIAVSGTVTSANHAIIYAETAGVITSIPYKEGAVVSMISVLATQNTPIANAQVGLAKAQADLSLTEQGAVVAGVQANYDKTKVNSYSAKELATLRELNNNNRLAEVEDSLRAAIKSNSTVALSAMDFINNNRPLFTAEGLRLYDEALKINYGSTPSYFSAGFSRGDDTNDSLKKILQSTNTESENSIVTLQNSAILTENILETLNQVLISGERDIFDRGESNFDVKELYIKQKSALTSSLSSIVSTQQFSQQIIDSTLEDAIAQNLSVTISELDKVAADTQTEFAIEIATHAAKVSKAQVAMAVAQQSLGIIHSPFNGIVSRVMIEEGEYVMPGTPLLEIVGDGMRELQVSVPFSVAKDLKIGQSFVVDEEKVGVVERFSPVAFGNGITVIVALNSEVAEIGTSVRGIILLDTVDDLYVVPRSHVHFDSDGAFIKYQDGDISRVLIVQDAGDNFYLKVNYLKDEVLVPTFGLIL